MKGLIGKILVCMVSGRRQVVTLSYTCELYKMKVYLNSDQHVHIKIYINRYLTQTYKIYIKYVLFKTYLIYIYVIDFCFCFPEK